MPSIYFPPRVGGIESHVYYLARELARRGHVVTVVTTRTEPESPRLETVDGVEVVRLPSFGKNPIGWTASSLWSSPAILSRARRFDLIHAHTFAFAMGGSLSAILQGSPLVITVHSSHFLKQAGNPVMRAVFREIFRPASALLSTSVEIDGVVRGICPGAYTLPIVNGIDTETFKPVEPGLPREEGVYNLVCPRRLVEKNGVEYLVRALGHLKGKLEFKLYIAGDGPLRPQMEALARSLGVADRVVFLGSVDNRRMPGIFSAADLVVVPSLIEATSIAALEAMSCERVVAASRVGGLPEILDPGVGLLFEPGDPEAIAATVLEAKDMEDTGSMGREARRRVEANWSIRAMTDTHEKVYLRALGRDGGD
jgi:glycosyltransferase involved in cell wall biosynthesis